MDGRNAQVSGNVSRHTAATMKTACVGPNASPAKPYTSGATAPLPIVPV
jgi:hypothetical protein